MTQELERYFIECEENRDLLRDVLVVVPARPHDGVAIHLAQKLAIWHGEGTAWTNLEDSMGGFIELTRTRICLQFLKDYRQKFLLMIDSDTEPPINLPYLLARHDKPVVGSCIVSMSREGRPMLCLTRYDKFGISRFIDFEDGDKIPATGLVEVPHVGTGAMMIRRDVLESFTWQVGDSPFFVPEELKVKASHNGQLMRGEDINFCLEAKKRGYAIHVDLEAHCGHRKSMRLSFPQSLRDATMDADEWVAPERGIRVSC